MKKIAIIFVSLTGKTADMAGRVASRIQDKAEVEVFDLSQNDSVSIESYDAVAFGCPAMGNEVLEEDVFEPFFSSIESSLNGRRIALFGSYGWGDGEWMRTWEDRCDADGAVLVCAPVIGQEGGDESTAAELDELADCLIAD